jgi:hypothetical protein
MATEQYEGWTNYETWCVALWLDNEQTSYEYWQSIAEETRLEVAKTHDNEDSRRTFKEEAEYSLAAELKSQVTESAPTGGASLYSDLLNAALADVHWHEVAAHMLAA